MNRCRPIQDVARELRIDPSHLVPYGNDKAKVRLEARDASQRSPGKLVLISAITPTGAGEGKTTVAIGLAQGLARIGESACLALREPSLGPTFGIKGGATGGGRSALIPADDINLHFTGDFHAVTSAHNLLAALLDNHLHHDLRPRLDPRRVHWRRVIDLSDLALRQTIIGLGGVMHGVPRETGFDITPASEVMAILCLADDEADLRARLSRLVVAETEDGQPFTAGDLGAVGPMMVLLRDAMLPNLVQTVEGVPAFVHGGPFASIAHGCNSVIATRMAMAHADWTVTEAGFGFALGAEKFFDIKCRYAGLDTAAVVLVATVRALKRHGGVAIEDLGRPDPGAVERGMNDLRKHVESIRLFDETPIVAVNRFDSDTDEEIAVIREACLAFGVEGEVADLFQQGGDGAMRLARTVVQHAETEASPFQPLYEWDWPVRQKLARIATDMYGSGAVSYAPQAERDLSRIERLGYAGLPLCVAKAPTSHPGESLVAGRPSDFELKIERVLLAAGAGYLVPMVGNIPRMPGLPRDPRALRMDLVDGEIRGVMAQ